MTTNLQHNEIQSLSEAELDAVCGGTTVYGGATTGMTSSWTVVQQELAAAYARNNPNPYNWHNW